MPTAELPDIKDAGIVVDFTHWGNPFHGYITGSTLNLDGGGTHTIPATTTNDCFVFRVPGAPGGQGDVAPLGGEWRDYLLLYGQGKAVYESVVATTDVNWLFCRADGTRWLVSITSAVSGIALNGTSLAIGFRASRFGHLVPLADAVPEYYDFTLTLADRGLDASSLPGGGSGLPTASIGISDITPRGDKCCLMFYYADTTGGENENQRLPYAFFEVVLDDAGVTEFSLSSVAMIYDIVDVAGTRTEDLYQYFQDTPPPLPFCDDVGYHQTISGTGFTVVDHIMAAWYDSTNALQPIYMNYDEPFVAGSGVLVGGSSTSCGNYSVSVTDHSEFTAIFGNAAFGEYTLNLNIDYSIAGDVVRIGPGTSIDEALSITFGNGGTLPLFNIEISNNYSADSVTAVGTLNRRFTSWLGCTLGDTSILNACYIDSSNFHPWLLDRTPAIANMFIASWDAEANNAPLIFAKRFNSTLIGFGRTWIDKDSYERITHIDKFLTKSGFVENTYSVPVDIALGDISATINPVTLEIAIGSDGVWRSFV